MSKFDKDLIEALEEAVLAEEKTSTTEKNIVQCKNCKQYKIKISDGKYPDGRNTRFINDIGQLWSGKTCPKCHTDRMKECMKTKRVKNG